MTTTTQRPKRTGWRLVGYLTRRAIMMYDIESVTGRKHTTQDKQPKVTIDEDGEATLHLRMQNETNIEVQLKAPTEIRLPAGPETISKVTLYADDSEAIMNEVQRHL